MNADAQRLYWARDTFGAELGSAFLPHGPQTAQQAQQVAWAQVRLDAQPAPDVRVEGPHPRRQHSCVGCGRSMARDAAHSAHARGCRNAEGS